MHRCCVRCVTIESEKYSPGFPLGWDATFSKSQVLYIALSCGFVGQTMR